MNLLNRVKVTIIHEGCWTNLPSLRDIYTINYNVYPEKGYLRSRIIVPKGLRKEVLKMKNYDSIKKINHIHSVDSTILVDFLNTYKDSIAGYLYDNEVLFLGNMIGNGKETWDFITTKNKVNEIINGLSSMGKIVDVKIKDCPRLIPQLSSSQLKVLRYALSNGYLDYPRIMDAEELAKKLNISKITFLYHLRAAERKLIEFYLDYLDDELQ
ncbi:helix-turn-helix domain-containing protein [Acidianus brierleyi]|uniref:HTH bat-type domain-containing protein n=1 Tax=Acidianus brierleyi TaxID=41673 RepID=A0A2U9IIC1_9CREN|nr:helix-turn-helix domain-containing protein [Acidianus brierleyi]AWR95777.1 hypothetical protein DFR85_15515 [Acidianus brierleyi]